MNLNIVETISKHLAMIASHLSFPSFFLTLTHHVTSTKEERSDIGESHGIRGPPSAISDPCATEFTRLTLTPDSIQGHWPLFLRW